MSTTDIFVLTGGVVLIFGIFTAIGLVKKRNYRLATEEAEKFLDGIRENITFQLNKIIENYEYKVEDNLVGIEYKIIESCLNAILPYIKGLIFNTCLTALAIKIMDDEYLTNYIVSIINESHLFEDIEDKLSDHTDKANEEFAKEDEELNKEYSDKNLYYTDEVQVDDKELEKITSTEEQELVDKDEGFEWRGFSVPSKEEEAQLNPQSDEEEKFNSEDESMEEIPENTFVDSKGRLRDKTTGRYVKR